MTLEKSYKTEFQQELQKFKDSYLRPLDLYRGLPEPPSEMVAILEYRESATRKLKELEAVTIQDCMFDPTQHIRNKYAKLNQEQEAQKKQILSDAEQRKAEIIAQHDTDIKNAELYNQSLISPLRTKHEELLAYQNELSYVFDYYDITPLDMDISDNLTTEEFTTLIDSSIAVCLKYKRKDKGIFEKLTSPLRDEANIWFTLSYVFVFTILAYLLLPILSVPAIILMSISVHNMYKDIEKLRIARVLMSQINYNRFIPEEEFQKVSNVDTSSIDVEAQEHITSMEDLSIKMEQELTVIRKDAESINSDCTNCKAEIQAEYNAVMKDIREKIQRADALYEKLKAESIFFPNLQNDSVVMNHNFVVGKLYGEIDVTDEIPMKNIVFCNSKREEAINDMKLYLANALLSVRVKQLTVEIYDPREMCAGFSEFFVQETKPYIKPNDMTLDKLLETYRKYSQENVIMLDSKTIDEFNEDAERRELVPKEYKLLLLVSDLEKLNEGDKKKLFDEYLKYSANTGVMVWMIDRCTREGVLSIDGSYKLQGEKLQYTRDLGKAATKTYVTALAKYKDRGIAYGQKFGEVYIPRDKWWTFDTIKGIMMPYGLEDGDPTRGLNVAPALGDANVHALLGGATGAGKSACINQLLISLITMYPPSELMIILIDFKNVEAAKFTRGFEALYNKWMDPDVEKDLRDAGEYYTRISRIPHLKIISGTTDGEYALSVFEYLMAEMARRQEIINKFGVTKVQEMREQILASYNKEHNSDPKKGTWAEMRKDWDWYKPNVYDKYGDLPRLLVIFDEFQVMYNPEFVENKVIDMINGKITAFTKLARAMSAHFWFTSQSMKGTMSKDTMGNFSLRGALRCTADVSDELLGNKAASEIKEKFGFMYTNDSAGTNKDANRKWRVPFLDEKDMPYYIDTLNDMLDEFNEEHRMAEFYDEKILVPSSVFEDWYKNYTDIFKSPDTFILGERANYSINKAPLNITLQEDGGENIMIAAFDRNDMLNLTMTMIDNLKQKEECTIIMNVQDKDTHTLLDVENIVNEAFLPLSYPRQDIDEFITALDQIVEKRSEINGPYKPIYIFCVQWERAPGISVDINYKMGDRFKDLLRKAPTVGMHFIFACREKLDMQRFIPAACNHRICGLLPKDSVFFIETTKVEKLPSAAKKNGLFAIYEYGTTLEKFRIYQHTFTKQIQSREIVL